MDWKTSVAMFSVALSLVSAPLAASPHSHAHGKGEMEITVQDGAIRAIFRTPMDSLLGFEHAPKTEAQKTAVTQLKNKLSDPTLFFTPTPAAQCTVSGSEASSALFVGKVSGSHSDLEYRFSFKCANPPALSGMDALLFANYPRLHEIRALVITDKGQRAVTLKKRSRTVSFN
jgi:hypothetical protein